VAERVRPADPAFVDPESVDAASAESPATPRRYYRTLFAG